MNTAPPRQRRPLVGRIFSRRKIVGDDWSFGPRPAGRALVRAPGASPLQLLLLGGGPAVGYGVITHELALAGHLARELARATGRGIDLEVDVAPVATVGDVERMLNGLDLGRFDAVILAVGVQDALEEAEPDAWGSRVAGLVLRARTATSDAPRIYLLGVPKPSHVVAVKPAALDRLDRRASEYNARLRALASTEPGVTFLEFAPAGAPRTGRHRDSETYHAWAKLLTPQLKNVGELACGDRQSAISEESRARAIAALGVLDSNTNERFDRIVNALRDRFGAQAAALSFMTADRQVFKSVAGARLDSVPRGATFCEWTVARRTPFFVYDSALDERFAELPFIRDANIRAYAGHPILDGAGVPVGALCVIFREPRQFTDEDRAALREAAALVERALGG